MFRGVKVGDPVWSFEFGWGDVTKIGKNGFHASFKINFKRKSLYYSFDGKRSAINSNQTLFWNEIKYDIPPKPKRMVDKWIAVINVSIKEGETTLAFGLSDIISNVVDFKNRDIKLYDSEEHALQHNKDVCAAFKIQILE